jgi:hypothetical protein
VVTTPASAAPQVLLAVTCPIANHKEPYMPDKSPQKPSGKKAGKSLKEKREAKKGKKDDRMALGR